MHTNFNSEQALSPDHPFNTTMLMDYEKIQKLLLFFSIWENNFKSAILEIIVSIVCMDSIVI